MHRNNIDLSESSCTRDDAISIIAGYSPLRIAPLDNSATSEDCEVHASINLTLEEYLEEELDTLESDYCEAKIDSLPPEVIAEKKAALNRFNHYIKDAKAIAQYVDDEIAKLTAGERSLLRKDALASKRHGDERYTRNSVLECGSWIREQLSQVTVPGRSAPDDDSLTQADDDDISGGLSKVRAGRLYTSFALMVESYAAILEAVHQLDDDDPTAKRLRNVISEITTPDQATTGKAGGLSQQQSRLKKPCFLHRDGCVSASAMAKHLELVGRKANYKDGLLPSKQRAMHGQTEETIRRIIPLAISIKQSEIDRSGDR